jgi:hypothetical protein
MDETRISGSGNETQLSFVSSDDDPSEIYMNPQIVAETPDLRASTPHMDYVEGVIVNTDLGQRMGVVRGLGNFDHEFALTKEKSDAMDELLEDGEGPDEIRGPQNMIKAHEELSRSFSNMASAFGKIYGEYASLVGLYQALLIGGKSNEACGMSWIERAKVHLAAVQISSDKCSKYLSAISAYNAARMCFEMASSTYSCAAIECGDWIGKEKVSVDASEMVAHEAMSHAMALNLRVLYVNSESSSSSSQSSSSSSSSSDKRVTMAMDACKKAAAMFEKTVEICKTFGQKLGEVHVSNFAILIDKISKRIDKVNKLAARATAMANELHGIGNA